MAPKIATIDASEPLDNILDAIARDGGVIVSNFLEPELLNDSMRASECSGWMATPYLTKHGVLTH
jgi:hypothetical protein